MLINLIQVLFYLIVPYQKYTSMPGMQIFLIVTILRMYSLEDDVTESVFEILPRGEPLYGSIVEAPNADNVITCNAK